jgi:type VI secretion system protein ImpL
VSLINYNYPVGKTFQWSADACSDVLFQIEVGDLTLRRKYTGLQAFPEFLQEFRGGQRTFTPSDFPGEKAALERLGIQYIKVNYVFSGEIPAVGKSAALALPKQAPGSIARCWD